MTQIYWPVLGLLFVISSNVISAYSQAGNDSTSLTTINEKVVADHVLSFSVDLIKILHHAEKNENLIFSPLSIYAALSLVYMGAGGKTFQEIGQILKNPEGDNEIEKFHQNLGSILGSVQNRPERVLAEVSIANGLFVRKGLKIKELYLNKLNEFYKSEIQKLDFTSKDTAFNVINKWVSDKTKGRIPQVFKEPLDSETLAVLASSLYFNGRWSEHFYVGRTKNEKFFTGVEEIEVPLMHNEDTIPYINNSSLRFEAIALEYDGKDFSMVIILPYANQTLSNLTQNLKPEHIKQIFDEENCISIDYKIPRMKFSSSFSLKDSLSKLGMVHAFNVADFSNMTDGESIQIGDVKHAAEIEVDEDGTKASAITTIQLIPLSGKVVIHPIQFYVNRPFLLLIYHRPTSALLFASAVHKPVQSS